MVVTGNAKSSWRLRWASAQKPARLRSRYGAGDRRRQSCGQAEHRSTRPTKAWTSQHASAAPGRRKGGMQKVYRQDTRRYYSSRGVLSSLAPASLAPLSRKSWPFAARLSPSSTCDRPAEERRRPRPARSFRTSKLTRTHRCCRSGRAVSRCTTRSSSASSHGPDCASSIRGPARSTSGSTMRMR